jgi:2-phosphoglycerate kinase
MAKQKLSLYEFMGEINTYATIEESVMTKAKESDITTVNNKSLKRLVSDWVNGVYDEDPEYLACELARLVN